MLLLGDFLTMDWSFEMEDREQKKALVKLIQRRFHDNSIKVVFLPDDSLCPPHASYLTYHPEITCYQGYIVTTEGVQIPFIAEVWPDDTTHVYLNPQKDFYLAHLVGDLVYDKDKTEGKGKVGGGETDG